jgi:23S rRNA (adenine2503-C2)-methyltransferase
MPIARREPLDPIFSLLRSYNWRGQRRLTLEYILFEGLNDSDNHCTELLRLTRGLGDVRINLLRWNALPGDRGTGEHAGQSPGEPPQLRSSLLRAAPIAALEDFQARLNDAGVIATIRQSRGEDIASACGLLSTQHKEHASKERP